MPFFSYVFFVWLCFDAFSFFAALCIYLYRSNWEFSVVFPLCIVLHCFRMRWMFSSFSCNIYYCDFYFVRVTVHCFYFLDSSCLLCLAAWILLFVNWTPELLDHVHDIPCWLDVLVYCMILLILYQPTELGYRRWKLLFHWNTLKFCLSSDALVYIVFVFSFCFVIDTLRCYSIVKFLRCSQFVCLVKDIMFFISC